MTATSCVGYSSSRTDDRALTVVPTLLFIEVMRSIVVLLAILVAACAVDRGGEQGGNGKADGNGTCEVEQYGDGTCQIDLACGGIPDIDCYITFDTDAAAGAWLQTIEPSTLVAETDPRFVRARKLLDRAWELYKSRNQLADLAGKRAALVVMDKAELDAFVTSDGAGKAGFSVQISTAFLVDSISDDEIVATMLHELTHLGELHVLDEVADRIRKFYIAGEGEPLGYQQSEDSRAKTAGVAWREQAIVVGDFTASELGGLPVAGYMGSLFGVLASQLYYLDAQRCATQVNAVLDVYATVALGISDLDASLVVSADTASRLTSALDAMRACTGPYKTFREFLATDAPGWEPYLALTAADQALADMPALDAMLQIVSTRREQLRATATTFAMQTQSSWDAVRYFSYEERADDSMVHILRTSDLDVPKAARLFLTLQEHSAAQCEQLVTSNAHVPYGAMLSDEHHGTCWRYAHALQLAQRDPVARVAIEASERSAHVPYTAPGPRILR